MLTRMLGAVLLVSCIYSLDLIVHGLLDIFYKVRSVAPTDKVKYKKLGIILVTFVKRGYSLFMMRYEMKRLNNLYDKIYDFNNLYDAYLKARKNKRYRKEVLKFSLNLEENLIILQNELIWGTYAQGKHREFYVYVPKVRQIKALPFKDRVLQHAVNNVLEPIFDKKFDVHSYACRKGKGGHQASNTLKKWLYNAEKQGVQLYCLKCDIRKYFDSVHLKTLYNIVKRKIKDKKLLWLIRQILELKTKERGIPIGNLTSQMLANVYLNELDKFVKSQLKVKKYMRYMDDFLILADNKEDLHMYLKEITSFLDNALKLELNHKTRIFPVKLGVEFVGYIHYANYIKVRTSTWKREKKSIKTALRQFENNKIDGSKVKNIVASIDGHLAHADAYTTRKRLNNYVIRKMEKGMIKE